MRLCNIEELSSVHCIVRGCVVVAFIGYSEPSHAKLAKENNNCNIFITLHCDHYIQQFI